MHSSFYRQTVFTQKKIRTEVLRREGFPHNIFYIQTLLIAHGCLYTDANCTRKLVHTARVYTHTHFTQRGFASPSWSPTFRVPPLKSSLPGVRSRAVFSWPRWLWGTLRPQPSWGLEALSHCWTCPACGTWHPAPVSYCHLGFPATLESRSPFLCGRHPRNSSYWLLKSNNLMLSPFCFYWPTSVNSNFFPHSHQA